MTTITSLQNQHVKDAVRLRDGRHRQKQGRILIDGARELARALEAGVPLLEVFVSPGDQVEVGTRLAILEAMKMQHDIFAEVAGTVQSVLAAAGSQVAADDLLIEIEIEAT